MLFCALCFAPSARKKKGAAKEVETEAVQATDDAHDAPRNTEGRTESGAAAWHRAVTGSRGLHEFRGEEKQDTTEDAGPAGPADADAEARSEALEAVHAVPAVGEQEEKEEEEGER